MKKLPIALALAAITAGAANAATLTLTDFTVTSVSNADVAHTNYQDITSLNGGSSIVNATVPIVYAVTKVTLDPNAAYAAYVARPMFANSASADQVGVDVKKSGDISTYQVVPSVVTSTGNTTLGVTTTLIYKITWTATNTTLDVWINPTASATEGASDIGGIINSGRRQNYIGFNQKIITTDVGEVNTISGTKIFTLADASFANVLAYAVPEPSAALLGGIGMLALLRRRRN